VADNLPDVYLRFVGASPEIPGESLDAAYPASEGWLGIKEFNFGFGWSAGGTTDSHEGLTRKLASGKPLTDQESRKLGDALNAKNAPTPAKSDKQEQALKADAFTFSRNPGPASVPLLKVLKEAGNPIPKAEVIVCRSAAQATVSAPKDAKIPFLELVLEKVTLKECNVSISKDSAPSENITFEFEKATIQTIWTDSATGEKATGGLLSVWFDFSNASGHVSWAEGEAGDF
jgi:type VI protein secretion system component Hcp